MAETFKGVSSAISACLLQAEFKIIINYYFDF
jgi:hypothetical protein